MLQQKCPRAETLHQHFTQNASEPIGAVDGIVYSVNFVMIGPLSSNQGFIMRGIEGK